MGLATGFQYFYQNVLGLNPANVVCAFDFHTQSGDQIVNQPWVTNGVNGTIFGGSGGFYSPSGSGNFNGTRYVGLNSGVNLSDWTVFLSYQRSKNQNDEILFSTFTGNSFSTASGFRVGVNQGNKVYMEYWNGVDGPQIYTMSEIVSDSNILSISKTDSTIFLNYYNTNNKENITQENAIYQNNFISSDRWAVGGETNSFIPSNNFSGYIDGFYLVSGFMDLMYQNICISGLYANFINPSGFTTISCVDISYLTGISTGIGTGIIGYQTVQIGNIVDNCGRNQAIYTYSGITGIISGDVYITITGSECSVVSGQTSGYLWIDSGYLNNFGLDQVSLLWDIESGVDFSDCFVITGQFENTTRNKIARWNALEQRYFLADSYGSGNISLWLNTQLQLESGYNQVIQGYGFDYFLTGDYIITGNKLLSTGYYTTSDSLTYDLTNRTFNSIFFTGISSGEVYPYSNFANSMVFVNGVKQASGLDFTLPNISLRSIDSGQNVLTIAEISGNNFYSSGNTGFLTFPKYLKLSSACYFNGERQKHGDGYIENSSLDLLSGNYLPISVFNPIYLNTDDFLNYPSET